MAGQPGIVTNIVETRNEKGTQKEKRRERKSKRTSWAGAAGPRACDAY